MTELRKRTLSAVVFGPLVIACFYFLPPNFFFLFVALIAVFAAYELMRMSSVKNPYLVYFFSLASLVFLYLLSYQGYLFFLVFSLSAIVLISISRTKGIITPKELLNTLQTFLFSSLFISFPLYAIYSLKAKKTEYAICLLFSVWASDILAYFFGGLFGKRKLSPSISPGKTLEGLIGAILGPVVVLVSFKNSLYFSYTETMLYGLLLGFSAQAGDLLESAIKRVHNVKDSSQLIPGHGGILDRLDSFILTSPILNYVLTMRS